MATTMRARADLERQHAAALAQLGAPTEESDQLGASFASGVADVLEWVLGVSDVAPITLKSLPWPSASDLAAEHGAAEDVLYGRREAKGRDRAWLAGVEHTLLWAYEATPTAPISGTTELRSIQEIRAELDRLNQLTGDASFTDQEHEQIAGSRAVLRWVIGENEVSPLSGRERSGGSPRPELSDLEDEADLADRLRYGNGPLPSAVPRRFVAGVDQGLRWVQNRSERSAL